jgi:hypothetical protein
MMDIFNIIIIISPQQSTAGHRPLQLLAIWLDLQLLVSSSRQPSRANRHSTWPEGVLHYVCQDAVSTQNSFTPAVIGSTADMASPLPLQRANTVCYVGDFSLCRITSFRIRSRRVTPSIVKMNK